jgi:iron complex transport system substrate-binding protein
MTQPVHVLRNLFLPLLWALCTHALAAWPVQVVDDLGREVVMERPPARVVSMVPSHTELLCALGACERLVGRDTWSNYPPAVLSLPDLGSAFAPDLEMLVALRPDLVLVDEYSGLTDALAGLGVVVFAGTAQQLVDIYDIAERVGALLGLPLEAASMIAAVQAEVAAVAAAVAGRERPQVYYELDPSPYSVGPASYLGTLIELAGGRTIVPAALGDFPLLDPEFVVAANPAVIVLGDAMYGIDADLLRQRPGWAAIAAIRTGHVVELNQAESDMLSRAGPRVGAALALLARAFHPGAF